MPGPPARSDSWCSMAAVSCKLLLMGNGSVGKTSICQRFKDDGFQRVYRQTTGVDFLEKTLEVRCVTSMRVCSHCVYMWGCAPSCRWRCPPRCWSLLTPTVTAWCVLSVVQTRPPHVAAGVGHWRSKHQLQDAVQVHFWRVRRVLLLRCHGDGVVQGHGGLGAHGDGLLFDDVHWKHAAGVVIARCSALVGVVVQ